jgi:hypothetical protein
MILIWEAIYLVLLLIPTFVTIFWVARVTKQERAKSVVPFAELQRRPAGESARLKLEKYSDDLNTWLMAIVFIPAVCALGLTLQRETNFITITLVFLAAVIFTAVAGRKIRSLLRERACYRLGFEGERYVAEELNQLMADGFRVFHDVPFDNYNLDHVLVGPPGVFVIETKTRRKPVSDEGDKAYKVTFDGVVLHFPKGSDKDALDQVRRNRDTLSKWLSSATGDRIKARGILAIPGWFVEQIVPSADVQCLNPKQIRSAVLRTTQVPLTAEQIQRASHQLEQKCKLPIG